MWLVVVLGAIGLFLGILMVSKASVVTDWQRRRYPDTPMMSPKAQAAFLIAGSSAALIGGLVSLLR